MRLSDDFDDRHSGVPVIYMAIGMFLFVITVVGAVVLTNKKPQSMERPEESAGLSEEETTGAVDITTAQPEDPYISGSDLTSDDLDFWHMYDETESTEEEEEKQK